MIDRFVDFCLKPEKKEISRTTYGNFAILVGLIVNLILFAFKMLAGLTTNSIAIKGDAINNLSDSLSCIMSLISFKISSKPPDKEHPFGHARTEYLFSSMMAMVIIYIAISLFKESVNKILNPQAITFTAITGFILIFSILAKLWQSRVYKNVGDRINSGLLIANSLDSKADVLSTTVILISAILSKILPFQIDGYMGVIVSILIFKSGFDILKDTINSILGEGPTIKEEKKIIDFVESYDKILGTHDLIVHDYGPNHVFASIHAEVDSREDILDSHSVIDMIENDAISNLGIQLIIHMDPLVVDDERLTKFKKDAQLVLSSIDEGLSLHDFRIVDNSKLINLIFDVDIPPELEITDEELLKKLSEKLKKINHKYHPVVTIDRNYIKSSRKINVK